MASGEWRIIASIPSCRNLTRCSRLDLKAVYKQSSDTTLLTRAHRPVVGLLHSRQRQKIHPLFTPCGDSSRRVNPLTVAVEQQRRHHDRMERRVSPLFLVLLQNLTQIQFLRYQVPDEHHHIILIDPIHWRWWKHQALFWVPCAKRFCHVRIQHVAPAATGPNYLDRLLEKEGNGPVSQPPHPSFQRLL